MFGEKLLNNPRMRIRTSETGLEQFNIVLGEIKKLCDETNIGWDLTASDMFDKVRKVCFAEGIVCGALITGVGIVVGVTIAKHTSKPKE